MKRASCPSARCRRWMREVKQWLGSSRGRWEGNTLVVETTNFNGESSMTSVGTPGAPRDPRATSTQLKIVERFERTEQR